MLEDTKQYIANVKKSSQEYRKISDELEKMTADETKDTEFYKDLTKQYTQINNELDATNDPDKQAQIIKRYVELKMQASVIEQKNQARDKEKAEKKQLHQHLKKQDIENNKISLELKKRGDEIDAEIELFARERDEIANS